MSGHSKWATIKRKKGVNDTKRAGVFTKIGREIAVAVKCGGADTASNSRLRDAIAKAKSNNMPNDNIVRSIKKASGEIGSINYEENVYEGYGAGGVAVIVETLTDNKNRTAGDIRHHFDKCGGSMGTNGCVSYMFSKKGVIIADMAGHDDDSIMELAIEAGADDVVNQGEFCEIFTDPTELGSVREALEATGKVVIADSMVDLIPENYIKPDPKAIGRILKLIDMLEDNDDVQNIYHNADLDDVEEEL